jgi:hypothetical protein
VGCAWLDLMTVALLMLDDCQRALEPLQSTLAADGYVLRLESNASVANHLTLTVVAGPDACEECLVPAGLFTEIVTRHLAAAGLSPNITVVYPDPT